MFSAVLIFVLKYLFWAGFKALLIFKVIDEGVKEGRKKKSVIKQGKAGFLFWKLSQDAPSRKAKADHKKKNSAGRKFGDVEDTEWEQGLSQKLFSFDKNLVIYVQNSKNIMSNCVSSRYFVLFSSGHDEAQELKEWLEAQKLNAKEGKPIRATEYL